MRLIILFSLIVFSFTAYATEGQRSFKCQLDQTFTVNKAKGTASTSTGGSLVCYDSKGQFAVVVSGCSLTVKDLNKKTLFEVLESQDRQECHEEIASE